MSDHNPITEIKKLGIPVNSYIVAAQAAGDFRRSCDAIKYNEFIAKITGDPIPTYNLPMAQCVFGYLVQEHVRNELQSLNRNSSEIWDLAVERGAKLVKDQPWIWAEEQNEDTETSKITNREEALRIMKALPEGTPRAEIVKLLAERLEVTQTTAQSYIREAVKSEEVVVAAAPKVEKINKKEVAVEVVKANIDMAKKELIALLANKLSTTAAGAQTYYYSAIKQLEIAPPTKTKRTNTKALVSTLFDANPNISKLEFLEQAEIQFNVQVSTAQTYYYAILKDRAVTQATRSEDGHP